MPSTISTLSLRTAERFPATTEPAISLVVNHRRFSRDADVDAVIANEVAAEEMTATQDGRGMRFQWHDVEVDGPEADWVYYERHDATGVRGHGWVDSESRKLLQVG